jgi:hypothetical protein
LFAHIFVGHHGSPLPPRTTEQISDTIYRVKLLTKYKVKKSTTHLRRLIGETASDKELVSSATPSKNVVTSHWDRNLTLNIISDPQPLPFVELQGMPHIARHVQFANATRLSYLPILYVNEFWTLTEDLDSFPINDTVEFLPLYIDFSPTSMWKFRLMTQLDESFKVQQSMMGANEAEIDNIRRAIFETNPVLLVLTLVVSILHSLFDFLAFKNGTSNILQ